MNPEIHYNLVLRVAIAGPYFFTPYSSLSLSSPVRLMKDAQQLMCVTNLINKL